MLIIYIIQDKRKRMLSVYTKSEVDCIHSNIFYIYIYYICIYIYIYTNIYIYVIATTPCSVNWRFPHIIVNNVYTYIYIYYNYKYIYKNMNNIDLL